MVKTKPQSNKVSLNIISVLQDGFNMPLELKYEDDTFEVKNAVRSMKFFNGATRWKCTIDGRDIQLFNLGDVWWMEQ